MSTLFRASIVLVGGLALLWTGSGCRSHRHAHEDEDHGHPHPHEGDDHGHGHGDGVAIGITVWTQKVELFAEHAPAVVGKELPLLAHLTVLEGFRPLEKASVTLELSGPASLSGTAAAKLRPGIFQPVVTPKVAGKYRGRLIVGGPEVEEALDGFEIEVYADEKSAATAHPPEKEAGGQIAFLKEQQWQVPFATAFARQGSLVPTVEVPGTVDTPPGGQAEVGAPIAGRVVAPPAGLPRPGQAVKKGELLGTLAPAPSSPEESARASLATAEAEARAQAARTAVERTEALFADRAVPERDVEAARRELKVAEESVRAARRAAALFSGAASGSGAGSWRLTAPISGVVAEVEATPGEAVQPGHVLFRIVNSSELWIRARVPEQSAARLESAFDASFRLAGIDDWFPIDVTGDDATASLVSVSPKVNPDSRTVEVIYALRAPDPRLRVGALVRVSLPAGAAWRGVVVPRSAVLDEDGRQIVYVQVEGEAFEERPVRVGPRSGGFLGIERNLEPGERVVTEGAHLLRLAARASTAPAHGHVH